MVTAARILEAIGDLSARMGEPPNTGDLASEFNVDRSHVSRRVADLVLSGAVRRIGRGPATRLIIVGTIKSRAVQLAEAVTMRRPHDELEALAMAVLEEEARP